MGIFDTLGFWNSIFILCSTSLFLISTVIGLVFNFNKRSPLFLQIVTCGSACILLGDIYYLSYLNCIGDIPSTFYIGDLGTIGGYLFFISAYLALPPKYTKAKKSKQYNFFVSIITILLVSLMAWAMLYTKVDTPVKVTAVIYFAILIPVFFLSVKYLLIPLEIEKKWPFKVYNFSVLIFALRFASYFIFVLIDSPLATISYMDLITAIALIIGSVTIYRGYEK